MDLLRFFRINDLYRFFFLVFLFLGVRAILFYFGTFVTANELRFFVVAKFFSQGKWLYRDVWETCEPLSSLLYFCLPSNFSYFSKVGFWLNFLLLAYNAFYFNSLLQKLDVLPEKTFLPSFFFLLLALSSPQFATFSPPLIASLFLLFVLNKTLSYLKKENPNEMYEAGFFLGLSSFCYLPSFLLVFSLFLTMLFFTRSTIKAYLLLFSGMLFPWLILAVIYLWKSGTQDLFAILIGKYFFVGNSVFLWKELVYSILPVSLIFLTGVFYSLKERAREINYQNICRHFMMIWMLGNILVFFSSPVRSFSDFHLVLAPLSFFFTYYYLQIKKTFVPNLIILISICIMLFMQVRFLTQRITQGNMSQWFISASENDLTNQGKKLWLIGSDYRQYIHAQPTLKYLNWDISKDDLNHLDHFTGSEHVRLNLEKTRPEWIIDENHIVPSLFERIPILKSQYVLTDVKKSIYHLK